MSLHGAIEQRAGAAAGARRRFGHNLADADAHHELDRFKEIERRLRDGRDLREITRALQCSRKTAQGSGLTTPHMSRGRETHLGYRRPRTQCGDLQAPQ